MRVAVRILRYIYLGMGGFILEIGLGISWDGMRWDGGMWA